MSPLRAALARTALADYEADAPDAPGPRPTTRPADRRAHPRFTPRQLSARLKHGEAVTLIDVSATGALLETSRILRPDTDLVLQFSDDGSHRVTDVISRVLRSHVAGINGSIRYRAACAFSQPLTHPELAPAPTSPSFLQTEFALKWIVEMYLKPSDAPAAAGRRSRSAALIDALTHLRSTVARGGDAANARLVDLLDLAIAGFGRSDSSDAVVRAIQDALARELPLLTIRPSPSRDDTPVDRELMTFSLPTDPTRYDLDVTAEFPAGYSLTEGQFRLLKAGSYLVGLAAGSTRATDAVEGSVGSDAAGTDAPRVRDDEELPAGWHRVVVRYLDGQIVRGYSNDFHAARDRFHVCSSVNAPMSERLVVPLARLKAVFFVKTLEGDAERVDDHAFEFSPGARKVEVTFCDGEIMRGSTLSYKPNGHGFLLRPANSRSNNLRIYAMTEAIRYIRFLDIKP